MTNHYEILGLTENAQLEEIKVSYKKLAKKYHPDVNPTVEAEEKFVLVAAAYATLSNPISRRKFDVMLAQQRLSRAQTYARANKSYPPSYNRSARPAYMAGRKPTRSEVITDKLGGVYALLFIAIVALLVYGSASAIKMYQNHQVERLIEDAKHLIMNAETLFSQGDQKAALLAIDTLKSFVAKNHAVERYVYKQANQLHEQAILSFQEKDYKDAIWGMLFYMHYFGKQDQAMLYDLSIAYRAVTEYEKAIYILSSLLNNNYKRMFTISLIADIYHINLHNREVALTFYEMALDNIESEFKSTYGNAYRLLVNAENTPYIYKKIYRTSAVLYMELEQYENARKLLEWVIFFEPDQSKGYELLAITFIKLQQNKEACRLIRKAKLHNINLEHLKSSCNA